MKNKKRSFKIIISILNFSIIMLSVALFFDFLSQKGYFFAKFRTDKVRLAKTEISDNEVKLKTGLSERNFKRAKFRTDKVRLASVLRCDCVSKASNRHERKEFQESEIPYGQSPVSKEDFSWSRGE